MAVSNVTEWYCGILRYGTVWYVPLRNGADVCTWIWIWLNMYIIVYLYKYACEIYATLQRVMHLYNHAYQYPYISHVHEQMHIYIDAYNLHICVGVCMCLHTAQWHVNDWHFWKYEHHLRNRMVCPCVPSNTIVLPTKTMHPDQPRTTRISTRVHPRTIDYEPPNISTDLWNRTFQEWNCALIDWFSRILLSNLWFWASILVQCFGAYGPRAYIRPSIFPCSRGSDISLRSCHKQSKCPPSSPLSHSRVESCSQWGGPSLEGLFSHVFPQLNSLGGKNYSQGWECA